jgi:hypothetical protein
MLEAFVRASSPFAFQKAPYLKRRGHERPTEVGVYPELETVLETADFGHFRPICSVGTRQKPSVFSAIKRW